jgi:hypothetical protein
MQGFERVPGIGEFHREHFRAFVNLVREHRRDNPILSVEIEKTLGIRGSIVRALRHAAWRNSLPIASFGQGYYWAETAEEWAVVVNHIMHRYRAEQSNLNHVRAIAVRLGYRPISYEQEKQTNLFGVSQEKS